MRYEGGYILHHLVVCKHTWNVHQVLSTYTNHIVSPVIWVRNISSVYSLSSSPLYIKYTNWIYGWARRERGVGIRHNLNVLASTWNDCTNSVFMFGPSNVDEDKQRNKTAKKLNRTELTLWDSWDLRGPAGCASAVSTAPTNRVIPVNSSPT